MKRAIKYLQENNGNLMKIRQRIFTCKGSLIRVFYEKADDVIASQLSSIFSVYWCFVFKCLYLYFPYISKFSATKIMCLTVKFFIFFFFPKFCDFFFFNFCIAENGGLYIELNIMFIKNHLNYTALLWQKEASDIHVPSKFELLTVSYCT